MSTYLFIPGAYLGGWIWRDVANRLRSQGHEVFTPTLTGLGERVHLATPQVDLDTHIEDILNVIHFENLKNVILVGHSYGGIVVSGVAELIPEKLAHLVYLDAVVLKDGESFSDLWPAEIKTLILEKVKTGGQGFLVPVGLDHEQVFDERLTPHPLKTKTQKLKIQNLQVQKISHTYIYCTNKKDMARFDPITPSAQRAKQAGWRYHELATMHMPMWTRPRELVEILAQI